MGVDNRETEMDQVEDVVNSYQMPDKDVFRIEQDNGVDDQSVEYSKREWIDYAAIDDGNIYVYEYDWDSGDLTLCTP